MSIDLARIAAAAAREGAEVLCRRFRDRDLEARLKATHDYVSAADRESEAAIVEHLQRRLPEHRILTEEEGSLGPTTAEFEWVVDPLDGTNNYLRGLPIWGISIACRRGDALVAGVVYEPLGENLFVAAAGSGASWNDQKIEVSRQTEVDGAFLATGYPFHARGAIDAYLQAFRTVFLRARAIRRCGAASLDLAYTAAGIYDGFFEFRLSPWDIAAGALLIEEAGGRVTDLDDGFAYLATGNVVAGSAALHGDLLRAIREHASEALMDQLSPVEMT